MNEKRLKVFLMYISKRTTERANYGSAFHMVFVEYTNQNQRKRDTMQKDLHLFKEKIVPF
jgi:hypothetical protein